MATVGVSTREWTLGRTVWFTTVLLGWFVFAYLAVAVPGGLSGVAVWISSLSPVLQVVMWLLLLPYMMAAWVWDSTWELWMRVAALGTLVALTLVLSRPPATYR